VRQQDAVEHAACPVLPGDVITRPTTLGLSVGPGGSVTGHPKAAIPGWTLPREPLLNEPGDDIPAEAVWVAMSYLNGEVLADLLAGNGDVRATLGEN
jgi:hypothetical protein